MEQQTATETDGEVVEEDMDTWDAGCASYDQRMRRTGQPERKELARDARRERKGTVTTS